MSACIVALTDHEARTLSDVLASATSAEVPRDDLYVTLRRVLRKIEAAQTPRTTA